MKRALPFTVVVVLGCWAALPSAPAADSAPDRPTDAAAIEFFEKKVRPVLVDHCYKCHSAKEDRAKGGLHVDSRAALLEGGDNGPAIVPGQPEKSRLVQAIRYQNVELRMPPKGKLPDAVIADLAAWVKMGAPWPGDNKGVVVAKGDFDLAKRKAAHWAWQPIRPPAPPAVKNVAWPRGPVDAFILAKLEDKGLSPAAPADPRTLIRRLYFDLTGLPPTPAEIDSFVESAIRHPQSAIEAVVDRLLASPHFGERWARHWMDLVRYAETRGHEFDYTAPNAYQYRDYLIRAFNADVPYNQFVIEQVAGDLLPKPRLHPTEGFNESILGTGFWFLGEEVHSPVDVRQDEADRFDNRIDVFSKTFLGLTVSCARCHDHKFDAISTKDYYALYGFLKSSSYRLVRFDTLEHNRRIAGELDAVRERGRPVVQQALAEAARPVVRRLADYLLAAREVMHGGKPEDLAASHKLNPEVLRQWATHLKAARGDAADPMHLWARAAADPGAGDAKRLAELRQPWIEAGRKRAAEADNALQGLEVIVDYAAARSEDWLPDDVGFGPRPVRPGDLRWGNDPKRPVVKVIDQAAAEKDPTWDGLRLAPGSENDPGPVGAVVRAGRTIRTPTFKVNGGRVSWLVRGVGRAYVALDHHVLINGPLHGHMVQPIKTDDRFQWLGVDLGPYKDCYAHVEFTAVPGADFAVAMVVQGPRVPGSLDRPHAMVEKLLASDASTSLEKLAAGYQRLLADVIDRLGTDRIIGAADAADMARLANWLLQRPGLFGLSEDAAVQRITAAAGPVLAEQAKLVTQIRPESRLAMAMLDGSGSDEYVFIRGSPRSVGETVPRRFLEALAGPNRLPVVRGSGRLELARQMTDPALNPFLSRVIVNRVWHHLFGRGLVPSVDNFGVMGEAPSHPELLDYLADRFVQEGWSLKRLMRGLVLSNTYRMASQADLAADRADPDNRLWHRMQLRRLEGEAIRDAMLAISGRLDPKMYGPPVPVYLTDFQQGRGRPASGPLDGAGRRSLYIAVRRNFLSPMMLAFDTPIPFSTVGRRTVSNVPAQSLILMNDPFVHQMAELWARRVLSRPGEAKERIADMYQSAFGRSPSAAELAGCLEFLDRQAKLTEARPDDPRVWTDLAHALFNVKEFIFLR